MQMKQAQTIRVVIAGLVPAIHHFRKKMDARVEPAHDGCGLSSQS
jgi:hypothetical protein